LEDQILRGLRPRWILELKARVDQKARNDPAALEGELDLDRDSLPAEDRAQLGIVAGNYGEAGAINLYGPQYGLPAVISGVNSFWQRGYGDPPPQTVIVMGADFDELQQLFVSCTLAARTWNQYGIENEETRWSPNIYVCHTLRRPWPEVWKMARHFG